MVLEALTDFACEPSEAVMVGDSWSDVVAAQRAGCVGVLLTTGHGASLGTLLRREGVRLPVTLMVDRADGLVPTDYVKVRRGLAGSGGRADEGAAGAAAGALEEWIASRAEEEAELVWEALGATSEGVRVYEDLGQAVDELMAMASTFDE